MPAKNLNKKDCSAGIFYMTGRFETQFLLATGHNSKVITSDKINIFP